MNPLRRTRATYEQIADDYAARNRDRGGLDRITERFLELLTPGSLVFDIGCGPGFDTLNLCRHNLQVIGLDYSWGMMQAGRKKHQIDADFVQVDMRHLPFVKSARGLWVCASFLHVPRKDAPATLHGFSRVLTTEGIICLCVKQGDGEEWTETSHGHKVPRFFVYWQPETLDPLLMDAGFELVDGWTDDTGSVSWLIRFARKTRK